MVQQLTPPIPPDICYSERDGQPMSDNTQQFRWLVTIKENLEFLFAHESDVFVAGDLLWYPVEGNSKIRQAPDVLVAFGRPKGERGSYQQWKEDNIAPQVVFEILSSGNRLQEMLRKQSFYQRYGVEEYYIYSPETLELTGLLRNGDYLEIVEEMEGWISPRLQIRFQLTPTALELYRPDGDRFLTYVEMGQLHSQERQRAEQESQRADEAIAQLSREQERVAALQAKLKELGADPEPS